MPPGRKNRNTNSNSITYMSRSVTPRRNWNMFSECADHQTGDDRAGDAAEPADDGNDQPLDRERQREQRRQHPHRRSDHRARDAAENAGDHERHRIGALKPDAAELGRHRLLRDRPGRDAETRAVDQIEQRRHADDADEEDEYQVAAQSERAELDHHVVEQGGIGLRHAVGLVHHDLVDEEQHPHRGHQRRQRARERYEAETEQVDVVAENAGRDCRNEKHHRRGRGNQREDRDARIGSGNRGGGVAHVELVHHAEDQREADPDHRVGGSE